MKITWLGQAGLLLEHNDTKILVDPYLSNSCFALNPKSNRRMPIDESYLELSPDVIVLTHDHLDHTDPDTLKHYLKEGADICVLASGNAWNHVRQLAAGQNCVMFNRHTEWTQNGIKFTAVKAEHSDTAAVGVIIDDGDKKYYITGDTLYNTDIFEDLPGEIFAMFVPVNGVGNNMNMTDAARFAEKVGAEHIVPLHWGLFDELDPNDFPCGNKVIPQIYKEIRF